MLPYSVLQKSTVRIFRGHETDFTTKPGKNTIKKNLLSSDEHSQILDLFNFQDN